MTDCERLHAFGPRLRVDRQEAVGGESYRDVVPELERRGEKGLVAYVEVVERPPQDRAPKTPQRSRSLLTDEAAQKHDEQDRDRRVEEILVVSPRCRLSGALLAARAAARILPDGTDLAADLAVTVVAFRGHRMESIRCGGLALTGRVANSPARRETRRLPPATSPGRVTP